MLRRTVSPASFRVRRIPRVHGPPSVIGLVGLALLGCGPAPEPRPRNVLLIVVDSLRFDHLGAYGAAPSFTPALDALAEGGVVFERAYSTAPWTVPSVCSLLSGLHPTAHGVNRPGRAVPRELELLPQRLRSHGFRTAGVVSHKLLSDRYRFERGFDLFDQEHGQGHKYVSTQGVTDAAVGFLDELAAEGDPFFLFVHYFDPHFRYEDHADIDRAPARAGRLTGRAEHLGAARALRHDDRRGARLHPRPLRGGDRAHRRGHRPAAGATRGARPRGGHLDRLHGRSRRGVSWRTAGWGTPGRCTTSSCGSR